MSRKSEQYRCERPFGKKSRFPVVLSMDPLLVMAGFLVPSLVSWCGVSRFRCSDSSSGSFDNKCGQNVRSDAGGYAKRYCGEHVVE